MAATSSAGLRPVRALITSAARWSGRTCASAPFTFPMGVRHASTTKTEFTLNLRLFSLTSHDKRGGPGELRGHLAGGASASVPTCPTGPDTGDRGGDAGTEDPSRRRHHHHGRKPRPRPRPRPTLRP